MPRSLGLPENFLSPFSMPALLIVRPENRLREDAAACLDAGWQPLPLPLIRIEADAVALTALPARIADADAVFWVSPTAVETAAGTLPTPGRALHVAVGAGTAAALTRAGLSGIAAPPQGNDSEAVLALPLWRQLPPQAKILLVRGSGGRDWLRQQLTARGFQVACADIYRRLPAAPPWPFSADNPPDAAWVTSAELVGLLFGQAPPNLAQALKTLLYFTHHPRIAAALRQHGAQRIQLLASPSELSAALAALSEQQMEAPACARQNIEKGTA
ncbi:uroporphyrinogen-III synthase [Neisseria shayeganii]|uniref:Uroporphyrinogen-III synthase n=1 Tax=Neisseria shayeganii TaxID=607712 RepID=A0A7D7N6H5_9NEIS|nr:uroporphyrinogen-III synthase [Neisseria shayeganii]QMT39921.1 uroporphyrinogen-III synthase [Neisseria shayeganii]